MAHSIFRLSITPEPAPEVRRVFDFDGNATLHDVHDAIQLALELEDDELYAFHLSGDHSDRESEYSLNDESPHDSSQSRLVGLELKEGQSIAYSFEHRHTITVVSIADAEAPLGEPVLVESVGEALHDDDEGPFELPEYLKDVEPLAEAVLVLGEQLDRLYDEDDAAQALLSDADENDGEDEDEDEDELEGPPEAIVALLRGLAKAALELAVALEEDDEALFDLDEWSGERELMPLLAELPGGLAAVGELESALAVARAFVFAAPESFNGDIAAVLAESGKRDEALAQLEANLAQYPDSFLTALKAGAAYEALGDAVAAEASYRNALEHAEDEDEHEEAVAQLAGLLEDLGRDEEARDLLSPTFIATSDKVGRNDPCPCGSQKKYKKCHGA